MDTNNDSYGINRQQPSVATFKGMSSKIMGAKNYFHDIVIRINR
jgi:hypothetical protein